MKLTDVSSNIIDLSDHPSTTLINKIRAGDLILYEGEEHTVHIAPKKARRDMWVIGVTDDAGDRKYIKIIDIERKAMTNHEKKTMVTNIKGVVEQNKDDEKYLVELIQRYYENLYVANRYPEDDVRECMELFPSHLLIKSGVVI